MSPGIFTRVWSDWSLNWKSARLNFFFAGGAAAAGLAVSTEAAGADAATSATGASGAFCYTYADAFGPSWSDTGL